MLSKSEKIILWTEKKTFESFYFLIFLASCVVY